RRRSTPSRVRSRRIWRKKFNAFFFSFFPGFFSLRWLLASFTCYLGLTNESLSFRLGSLYLRFFSLDPFPGVYNVIYFFASENPRIPCICIAQACEENVERQFPR